MRWIIGETEESKEIRAINWHKWYAWYPVIAGTTVIDGREYKVRVWLDYVMRKGYLEHFPLEHWTYVYKEVTE